MEMKPPGGEGVTPLQGLIGMCSWMGSHFHDWSDFNGVAFSIDLLEWGSKFSDFGGRWGFKMGRFSVKKSESCCLSNLAISSHWPHYIPPLETTLIRSGCINRKWLSKDRENDIFQKETKMGSITGQKIDYNGVGALGGQRHIPSKH